MLAYGELVLKESTEGEGLIPFEIELDYKATDRVPTRIIIVASASYYGDISKVVQVVKCGWMI